MDNESQPQPICLGRRVRFFLPETKIMFSNNTTSEMSQLEGAVRCMQVFVVPFLSCFGIISAICSCAVLLKTQLRKKFFTHFLVCINVSSGGFLATVLTGWLNGQGVDVYKAPGLCQIVVFSSHFFPFLTCWCTLIGGYLILWDSLKPRRLSWMNCSSSAKSIVIIMAICGFTLFSYKTWTNGTIFVQGYRVCSVLPENEEAMAVLNFIDILFLLVVPSVFFLVLDVLLIITKVTGRCKLHKSECSKRHREVMRIVVAHSISFHCLVTPRGISMLVFIANRWMKGVLPSFNEMLTQQVFQFLFYAYFTVMTFLPLLTSKKYRYYFLIFLGIKPMRRWRGVSRLRRQLSFL